MLLRVYYTFKSIPRCISSINAYTIIVNEIITEAEGAKERITKEHAVTLMPASLRSCPNVLYHIEMTWRECLGWIIAQ